MNFLRRLRAQRIARTLALGRVVVTPSAADALRRAHVDADSLVRRHAAGDWGELDALDIRQNVLGLRLGLRMRSSYLLQANPKEANATLTSAVTVWVVTTPNRKTTTVLLPSEIFDDTNDEQNDRNE